MATNDIFHAIPIIEELQRIADSELKSALGLKSVMIGDITGLPTPGISNIIPGLWIQPLPATTNDFLDLPRMMEQKYFFRFVYVRLTHLRENIVKRSMEDATLIMNTYTDHYQPDVTNLPVGTHVLWTIVKSVEWRPPEDMYVQQVNADLAAIAFNMEANVQTRRSF